MFERDIRLRGQLCHLHRVSEIVHNAEGTTITVQSTPDDHFDANWVETWASVPLALGIDFEQAEQMVQQLPEYAEAEPEQSLVERMRAMLTPEQLAELGIE